MHTTASKGTRIEYDSVISPEQAIDVLSKNEVDVAVVTDHNTTMAYKQMKSLGKRKNVNIIRGIEISSSDGHIIGLGVQEGIDEKLGEGRKRLSAPEAVDLIKAFCGEVYIPHPFDVQRKGLGMKIFEIDGIIEVFNPMNIFGFENELADMVASKLGRPKAVGADAHIQDRLNTCITCIDAEPNEDSVLRTIKNGSVRFENCRYMSLREFKELILRRMRFSYQYILQKIAYGWEVDRWYMKYANGWLMRQVEREVLKLGVRIPNSYIWDSASILAYVIASMYAKRVKHFYKLCMKNVNSYGVTRTEELHQIEAYRFPSYILQKPLTTMSSGISNP